MADISKFKSVAIVTHVYATGPAFFLEDYLKTQKISKLLFIGLPFPYAKDTRPFYRYYEFGTLVDKQTLNLPKYPDMIMYLRDVILTVWWIMKREKFDLIVSVDNLNTFSAIILQKIKKVKSIVFYTIDFVPQRFSNKLLNSFYHRLEKIAVYKSNVVWNLSPVMQKEREKRGYDKKYASKQIVVPIGTEPREKLPTLTDKQYSTIAFMGHLREGQGVKFLIEAFIKLLKKNKKMRLSIIGGGILEPSLKKLVKKMQITKQVEFSGFVKDFKIVKRMLSQSGLAVAPYEDSEKSFTRYTDPGKVKDYISQGLPVIVTKVPQVSLEVDKRKAGIAIEYNQEEFVEAVDKIVTNKKTHDVYRENALQMAKEFTWDNIFKNALLKTSKLC